MKEILKKYPAPKNSARFKKYWDKFVIDVVSRPNFKQGHLFQLEVLCDLYVELEGMVEFIDQVGTTYQSDGRYGRQLKFYPEVKLIGEHRRNIAVYSKNLGIILAKDGQLSKESLDNENWD